jgi:D-sedoheptulose 7-phosphate isomerase
MDFLEQLEEHQAVGDGLRSLAETVERTAARVIDCLGSGGTVFWFGNGGSASQAQHLAAELVGRYEQDRAALRSIALTTDTAVLTAVSNDSTFDEVFARQLQALCRRGDVAIGLSTSGNSTNVVRGIEVAQAAGALTVGLTGGDGGQLAPLVDAAIVVPSRRTSRIQEAHLFIGHLLCSAAEAAERPVRT